MSAVIDTNILIYDTFNDTSYHIEAKKELDALEKWIIPTLVFHEYIWFMKAENIQYHIAKEKILDYINHEKTVSTSDDKEHLLNALNLTEKYSDYNDSVILSIANRLQVPLITYDKKLKTRFEELRK
jgi:hypothetical protein